MWTVEGIRRNAERLRELNARINATFSDCDRNERAGSAWREACAEFHRSFESLAYPGGFGPYDALAKGDQNAVEAAVTFLEADPWFFRSGYMKEYLWKHLKKYDLSVVHRGRLESSAIGYLSRQVQREFWAMGNFMSVHAQSSFWSEVGRLTRSSQQSISLKAYWLLLMRWKFPVRSWVKREVRDAGWRGATPNLAIHRTANSRLRRLLAAGDF